MSWKLLLPIILKWIDRFGEWISEIVVAQKKKGTINAINKIDKAIDDNNDQFIVDELRKLADKVEQRKKLS